MDREKNHDLGHNDSEMAGKDNIFTIAIQPITSTADGEIMAFKMYKRRWIGIIYLFFLNLIVSWNWIHLVVVGGATAEHFNTDVPTINWFSTAFMFASVLTEYPASLALQRSVKLSLVICSAVLLLGLWLRFAGTAIGNLGLAFVGQILIGFCQPFVCNAPVFYSETWFNLRTRATATAITSIANPLGSLVGGIIAPAWIFGPGDVSRTTLWLSIITTGIIVWSPFLPAMPPTPPELQSEEHGVKVGMGNEIKDILTSVEFYLIATPFILLVGLFNALSTIMWLILTPHGFDATVVGSATALLVGPGLGLTLILAAISDKWKCHIWIMKLSILVTAASYVMLIWVPASGSTAFLYGWASLNGMAVVGPGPVTLEFIAEILYPVRAEVAISIMWGGGQIAGALLVIGMGYMGGSDGTYMPAIYLALGLAIISVPFYLSLGLFSRREKVRLHRTMVEMDFRSAAESAIPREVNR